MHVPVIDQRMHHRRWQACTSGVLSQPTVFSSVLSGAAMAATPVVLPMGASNLHDACEGVETCAPGKLLSRTRAVLCAGSMLQGAHASLLLLAWHSNMQQVTHSRGCGC